MNKEIVVKMVQKYGGVANTARELGMPERTLYDWKRNGVQDYLAKLIEAFIDRDHDGHKISA